MAPWVGVLADESSGICKAARVKSKLLPALTGVLSALAVTAAATRVGDRTFQLPEGFELSAVTTTNLVLRPVNASFDDRGRLFVTDSSGSSEDPKEQAKDPKWRVVCLEDTDGDGTFDRSTVVADHLPMLQGILWHTSGLYIGGTPAIWKLSGFDAAGRATQRTEWWNVGHPSTHCGNEVHGPYRAPDGFIYWTKGAFEPVSWTNSVTGQKFRDRAAHIFRARPDGSAMESVMSGGMDNPVGFAFLPDGELMFTSTFIDFTQPGFRDGVAHASYGAVFGKVNSNLEDRAVVRTGPELMHPIAELGAAAPSGLCRYEGTQFGPGFGDNLFAAQFNHRKISRHALRPAGATFASETTDFVATDDMDFHPTDVLADADGSLLVVDTGGWYKLCCPSSQLWKPDVLGTVYRVRRSGAARVMDPWGAKLDWAGATPPQLRDWLSDARSEVRAKARQSLATLGGSAVPLLQGVLNRADAGPAAVEAIWALSQIAEPAARAVVRGVIATAPAADVWGRAPGEELGPVRRAAIKVAALWRDTGALGSASPGVVETGLLMCGQPAVRRNMAELLGRTKSPGGARLLLNSTHETIGTDPVLTTAVIRGLIETQDAATVRASLDGKPGAQLAALTAWAGMEGSDLPAAVVAPFLVSTDASLREAAHWMIQRRPEWGADLVAWFRQELKAPTAREEVLALLPIFTGAPVGREFLGELATSPTLPVRIAALKAIGGSGVKEVPEPWWSALAAGISGGGAGADRAALSEAAVGAARGLAGQGEFGRRLGEPLAAAGADPALSQPVRVDALALALAGRNVGPENFQYLQKSLLPPVAPPTRALAAEALSRAALTPAQLQELLVNVRTAGPLEVNRLLGAFDRGGDEALGLALIQTLRTSGAAHSLVTSQLAAHFAKFPAAVQTAASALVVELAPDTARQSAQLNTLLADLQALPRDIRRGQAVFNSPKAACSACHRIGYQGGNVGPDLTAISNGRSERDLLEAVVYPSASFVRSYEPVLFHTKNGDDISGVIRRETDAEVVVATGPGAEQRIAKADIQDRQPGTVSVMPAGLDAQLSRQELADLVAFLKNTKWGAN